MQATPVLAQQPLFLKIALHLFSRQLWRYTNILSKSGVLGHIESLRTLSTHVQAVRPEPQPMHNSGLFVRGIQQKGKPGQVNTTVKSVLTPAESHMNAFPVIFDAEQLPDVDIPDPTNVQANMQTVRFKIDKKQTTTYHKCTSEPLLEIELVFW